MDTGFDNLESTLRLEDLLLGQAGNIDQLCQTYLSNMDSFPKAQETQYNTGGYYSHNYSGYSNYSDGYYSAQDQGDSYKRLAVVDWLGEHCHSWAENVCRKRGINVSAVDLWSFKTTTGATLLQFSPQHFCALVGDQYAAIFFQDLQALRKKKNGKSRGASHDTGLVAAPQGTSYQGSGYASTDFWEYTTEDLKDLDRYIPVDAYDPISNNLADLDIQEQFMPIKCEDSLQQYSPPTVFSPSPTPMALASPAGPERDVFKKIPTNTRRKERGPKSWEFLVRLLADKRSNPTLIRWEDEASATFRLTQPAIIAQMWGARADKPNLSYVNFARGLRYHYNTGALEAVSERQLVYRCGPKALQYLNQLRNEPASGNH